MKKQKVTPESPGSNEPEKSPAPIGGEVVQPTITFSGTLKHSTGNAIEGVIVMVYKKELFSSELLFQTTTDSNGSYTASFPQPAESNIAYFVDVQDGAGNALVSSDVFLKTNEQNTVDLTITDAKYKGTPQFAQHFSALSSTLDEVKKNITPTSGIKLSSGDLYLIANKTGRTTKDVFYMLKAQECSDNTGIASEVFYGLFKSGMPANLQKLGFKKKDEIKSALQQAAANNYISDAVAADADGVIQQWYGYLASKTLTTKANQLDASFGDILSLAIEDTKVHQDIMMSYVNNEGTAEDFWNNLPTVTGSEESAKLVNMALRLGAFSGMQPEVTKGMLEESKKYGSRNFFREMARWDKWSMKNHLKIWATEFKKDSIVPSFITGETEDKRLDKYAEMLSNTLKKQYPTGRLAGDLMRMSNEVGDDATDYQSVFKTPINEMISFLNANPEFDFATATAEEIKEAKIYNTTALNNVAEFLVDQKLLNTFFPYTTNSDLIIELNKAGIISPVSIPDMTYRVWMNTYSGYYDTTTEQTNAYNAAFNAKMKCIALYGMLHPALNTSLTVLNSPADCLASENNNTADANAPSRSESSAVEAPTAEAEWRTMFGSLDTCECEHCMSVYSPAAYFTDLLHFLYSRANDSTIDEVDSPSQVYNQLKKRRPDLLHIDLSCENANTPMPYVDLVNELLELFILKQQGVHPIPESFQTLGTAQELAANPQHFYKDVSGEGIVTYPEYIRTDGKPGYRRAYQPLKEAVYPLPLPFNFELEEVRVYLKHLGIPRHEIMTTFFEGDETEAFDEFNINMERLQISPEEAKILSGETTGEIFDDETSGVTGIWNFYGFKTEEVLEVLQDPLHSGKMIPTESKNWEKFVAHRVDVFLLQTGITYKELLNLLQCDYINPIKDAITGDRVIQTVSTSGANDTCQLNELELNGMNKIHLAKIHRFIRLWRKTNWTIRELDLAFIAIGSIPVDETDPVEKEKILIKGIAEADRLHQLLRLPLEVVLSFWSDISYTTYIDYTKNDYPEVASLYSKLFLNKAVINELDDQFEIEKINDATGEFIKRVDGTIDHTPTIFSAMQISADDLEILSSVLNLNRVVFPVQGDTTPIVQLNWNEGLYGLLTIPNLSLLHRYALLSRKLNYTIADFISLLELTGMTGGLTGISKDYEGTTDLFADPKTTFEFLRKEKLLKSSRFSLNEVNYLIRHVYAEDTGIAPTDDMISIYISELRATLKAYQAVSIEDIKNVIKQKFAEHLKLSTLASDMLMGTYITSIADEVIMIVDDFLTEDIARQYFVWTGMITEIENPTISSFASMGSNLYAATSFGVLLSTDHGTNWTSTNIGELPSTLVTALLASGSNLFAGTSGGVFLSKDSGANWIETSLTFNVWTLMVSGSKLYAGTIEGVFLSEDNGNNWKEMNADLNIDVLALVISGSKLFAGTTGGVFLWDDKENKWIAKNTGDVRTLAVIGTNLFAGTASGVFLSTDDGEIWNEANTGLPPTDKDIRSLAVDGSNLFAATAGGVFQSTDNGSNWTEMNYGLPDLDVMVLGIEGANILAGTAHGVFLYKEYEPVFVRENINKELTLMDLPILFDGYIKLWKIAFFINKLVLSDTDLEYILNNSTAIGCIEFDTIPFNTLTPDSFPDFTQFEILIRLITARDVLPVGTPEFFEIIDKDENVKTTHVSILFQSNEWVDAFIERLGWDVEDSTILTLVNTIIGRWNLPSDFKNGNVILRTLNCLKSYDKLGLDVSVIDALIGDSLTSKTSEAIKNAAKAKHDEASWYKVAKPLRDQLREKQREALVAYVLTHPGGLTGSGIVQSWKNTDEMYEYFLIDVEMKPLSMTSRLKQAICTVQLFIDRVLLGVEHLNCDPASIDTLSLQAEQEDEWKEWRKLYRVWEANRKIFLYPENWIEPELRDNKSPFFEELESQLLQNELSDENVEDAFLAYLEKLDEVARLEVVGLFHQKEDATDDEVAIDIVHVIARTNTTPHKYFYRKLEDNEWSPWETMEIDIDSNHIVPVVFNRRLCLFWLFFLEQSEDSSDTAEGDKVPRYWKVQIAWSEYKDGKWSGKKISESYVETEHTTTYKDMSGIKESIFPYAIVDGELKILIQNYYEFVTGETEPGSDSNSEDNNSEQFEIDLRNFLENYKILPSTDEIKNTNIVKTYHENDYDFINDLLNLLNSYLLLGVNIDYFVQSPIYVDFVEKYAIPESANDDEYIYYMVQFTFSDTNSEPQVDYIEVPYYGGNPDEFTEYYTVKEKYTPPVISDNDADLVVSNMMLREETDGSNKLLNNSYDYDYSAARWDCTEQTVILNKTELKRFSLVVPSNYDIDPLGTEFFFQDWKNTFYVYHAEDYVTQTSPPAEFTPSPTVSQNILLGDLVDFVQLNVPERLEFNTADTYFESYFDAKLEAEQAMNFEPNYTVYNAQTGYQYNEQTTHLPLSTFSTQVTPVNIQIKAMAPMPENNVNPAPKLELYSSAVEQFTFQTFYHPQVKSFIKKLNKYGIEGLLKRKIQIQDDPISFEDNYKPNESCVVQPYAGTIVDGTAVDFAFEGSYSIYNWELFFHIPMLIACRLSTDQRFEEAREWFHYIFDPTKSGSEGKERFWQFYPFFIKAQEAPTTLIELIQNQTEFDVQIAKWEEEPFQPHVIARMRITAYMKNVVMKYIDNLINWADQLFRRDTIELINEATNLYILAHKILGERPQEIPPRSEILRYTFQELLDVKGDIDSFSNAMVNIYDLINSAGIAPDDSILKSGDVTKEAIGQMFYFCVIENEKLLTYWDTIVDRLFKIRHSMNIEGVFRTLPLYEPPIDPAMLVRAAAMGMDLSSILSDMYVSLPNYRFNFMVQKANELCNEVKSLGSSLLQALEKKDAEAMALLRSSQEQNVLKAVLVMKEKQVDEAEENLASAEKGIEMAQKKIDYYSKREFTNAKEKDYLIKLEEAFSKQKSQGQASTVASVLSIIPTLQFGTGFFENFGGQHLGSAMNAVASGFGIKAANLSMQGSKSSTYGGYDRRMDDWKFQADLAKTEKYQAEKQKLASQIRLAIAQKDLANQQLQIDNAAEMDEFMRSKFTNRQLYEWMIGQLATVYFQSYQLAYDVAKKAQKCYNFELGNYGEEENIFIQFGYWDSLKKGLLSAEKLQFDLRRMEKSFLENNVRDLEITKQISLSLLDAEALLSLRSTGICNFQIPELIFEMDFPDHYLRKIKSVSLSIPCIAGPYTSISAQLSLSKSYVRVDKTEGDDSIDWTNPNEHFAEGLSNFNSIATSSAQNDSGMFELNFRDERYLPFEGAGVISQWQLELPTAAKQFDYNTISDVIITLRYTAKKSFGGAFKENVNTKIEEITDATISSISANGGYYKLLSLKHDFPTDYYKMQNGTAPTSEVKISTSLFPYFARNYTITIASTGISFYNADGSVMVDAPISLNSIVNGASNDEWVLTFNITPASLPDDVLILINYKLAQKII